jgi:hypothetical protein
MFSGSPQAADMCEPWRRFRVVPKAAVSRCSKVPYSITSPASASSAAATRRLASEGFAERNVMECRDAAAYSGLIFANLTTMPHFSVSSARSLS